MKHLVWSLVMIAACGGKSVSPATTAGGEAPSAMHTEHVDMPAEVHDFHELLRPLWHATPGPERATAICDGADALATRAAAVVGAGAPSDVLDALAWSARADELLTLSETIGGDCRDGNTAAESDLGAVHDKFHALLELLPSRGGPGGNGDADHHHEQAIR
jgi:hypothetical protein